MVKGSGTTTGVGIQTQNSSGTALFTTLDNGFVGIGTASPTTARVEIKDAGTNASALLRIISDDENPYSLVLNNDTYSTNYLNGFKIYQDNTGLAKISNGGAAILLSGTVGINTSSAPTARFAVNGNAAFGTYTAAPTNGLAVSGQVSVGATTALATIDAIGAIYSGATPTNTVFNGTVAPNTANFVATNGYWALRTAVNNSYNLDVYNSGSPIAALTVLQNGNVGIGTTVANNKLEVLGSALFGANGYSYISELPTETDTVLGYNALVTTTNGNLKTGPVNAPTIHPQAIVMGPGQGIRFVTTASSPGVSADFSIDSNEKMRITPGGNVGIGTTTPGARLSVSGGAAVGSGYAGTAVNDGILIVADKIGIGQSNPISEKLEVAGNGLFTGTFPYVTLKPTGWSGASFYFQGGVNNIGTAAGDYTAFVNPASKGFSWLQSTTARMVIDTAGNVGIGTTTPDSKLHVYSAGASVVNIDSVGGNANLSWSVAGTNKWQAYTNGNDLRFYAGGDKVTFQPSGNVGIGTTTPSKKFVVNYNTVSTISSSDTNRPYWIYDYNNGGSVQWTSGYDIAGSNDFSIANIYSGTRDVFHIENAAPANAFRIIASSGNVGIGTTTPAYKLDVAGSISSDIGGGVGSYRAGGNRVLYSDTVSTYVGNLDASKTLSLVAGTSTGATILVNGNVGISTTTPGNRLVVVPAANEVAAQFTTVSGADSGFYITPHAANDVVLGSGAAYASAVFTAKATSASVLNMYAGGYDFYGDTGLTVGNTYTPTMRMTIKPGGNVGIGTTSPDKLLTLYAATSNIRIGVTDRAISFSRSSDGSYVASITNADLGGNLTFDSRNAHTFTADTFQAMKVYEDATAAKGKVLVGAGNIAPGYSYLAVNGNASFGSGYYTTAAPTDGLIVQGNVGIGTTSPTQKLYVNTGAATIDIRASSVGQGGLNIVGDGPTSYAPSIKLYNASTLVGALGASMGGEYSSSAGTNDVVLRSDVAKLMLQSGTGAAALTINTSNNVGIGTTNPGEKFHLVGNFKMNGVIFNSDTGTGFDVGGNQWKGFAGGQTIYDSQAAKILARFSNGSVLSTGDSTVAANASLIIPKLWADQISATDGGGGTAGRSFTVKAGDSSTQPQYGGGNGGNLLLQGGKATDNSLGNGGAAGYVAINTYAFGASSPTERMRIASDGNVGIGTTSPAQKLDVAGYVRAYSSSANVGVSLSYTGASGREYQLLSCAGCNSGGAGTLEVFDSTAGAARAYIASGVNGWQTPSDRRLKTNIETLTVLDKLSALRGTSYTLLDSGKQQIGVIAQELQQAFPFAVSGTESSTTYLGVSYDAVATIALQGVKELNDKLAALQVSIASLQGTGTHFGSATPIVLQAHLYLSSDSVGQAKVLAGATRVRIIFDRPYEFQPVVTVTPLDFVDAAYRVTSMDSTGFTIELRLAAQADVTFNWHAFASPEAKLTVSDGTTQQLMLAIPPSPTNGQASLAPTVSENEVTGSVDDTTQSNAEPQSEVVGESVDVSTQPEAATPLSEEMPTESGSGAAEE